MSSRPDKEELSVVHLGDTEIVDGVLVGGREVGPFSHAAILTGAAVVAVGSVVVGAVVIAARHHVSPRDYLR